MVGFLFGRVTMSDKPCPCCGHDDVAVNLAIKDILEQNETLRAERTAHAAEVERLTAKAYETKCWCDGYMAELERMDAAVHQLTAERDAAVARAERAEDALRELLGLIDHASDLPDAAANGNIWQGMDEGVVLASGIIRQARSALSPEPWGWPEGEDA